MKTRYLLLCVALFTAGVGAGFGQNPQMGTWKLNEAKSKVPAGVTKNSTVIYAVEGDKVKATTEGVDGSGKPLHTVWVGKFDGKVYPVSDDPTIDSRSLKMIGGQNLAITNMKGGKVVSSGTIVLTADGKSRTLSITGTDLAGKKIMATSVYDKQ